MAETSANNNNSQVAAVAHPKSDRFKLTPDEILGLVDPKNPALYTELGGTAGIAKALDADIVNGLTIAKGDNDGQDERRAFYSNNSLPEPVLKNIFQFMWEALQDKTLIVLCFAAAAEMGIGIYKLWFAPVGKRDQLALIDGGAIVMAVLIVVLVGSVSDYRKQAQFRALSDFSKSLSEFRVVRNGETMEVPTASLLVGDVCLLQTGDVIPADGVLIQGFNIQTDESSLTGEPISIEKDLVHDPFLLSGTKVVNGVGKMMLIATGINSMNGRSLAALDVEPEETPLQAKLGKIADFIAKFAMIAAISVTCILLAAYFIVTPPSTRDSFQLSQDIIALLILTITIVVVAVPEGLPLAVTLSLAHATVKMLKDNNLVRHLSACETMGNATTICSDKTGTLTMNQMTVVEGVLFKTPFVQKDVPDALRANVIANLSSVHKDASLAERLLGLLALTLNVNSTAEELVDKDGKINFKGSKTEVAILNMTRLIGFDYVKDRASSELTAIEPFSSERKRMSCIVRAPIDRALEASLGLNADEISPASATTKDWICAKGASEIILGICDRYIDATGRVQPLTADVRAYFEQTIDTYANNALRTIGISIRPLPNTVKASSSTIDADAKADDKIPDDDSLIFVGLVGILDPLRPEVPDAVASCQKAGVVVRMVTGDNLATAKAIARGCGILSADGIAMEGPKFRTLTQDQMDEILPRLQVLARSSPLDKQILVNNLKRLGQTVAVTGDGTNDAPALTAADVGFAMGIAGTEVAKEASDIVLMDDNFASLVKAVVWGRCVYDSIRKFLQFQLTVNVSAVLIAITTAFYTTVAGPKTMVSALSAVQLLWINLIMDTFAALALATDPPAPGLLDRKPASRFETIISPNMFKMIVGQAIYQIGAVLVLFFQGPKWFGDPARDPASYKESGVDIVTATIIFNAYVFCQVFNQINCRSISRDLNVFKGFFSNPTFLFILFIMILGQTIIVQFAGVIFKTDPSGLTIAHWALSVAIGLGSFPVGFLVRILPDFPLPAWMFSESQEVRGQPPADMGATAVDLPIKDGKSDKTTLPAVTSGPALSSEFSATAGSTNTIATAPSGIWGTLRDLFRALWVVNAFRGRSGRVDYSTVQMVDFNQIRRNRMAAQRQARASTTSGPKH
ncbi:hypothetical protein BC831DRAFT_403490 [Entophlyctis helioformis]|nr:hypothetical protein BC831DRAFT_403490 [Entophlyctis helioformis]